jgi:long-chain acyl-CoA synthetase
MPLPATPVFQILTDAAAKYPNSGCMEFLGKRWTYSQTAALAARVAAGLQKRGVGKGTRIGLLLPNTPYYIAVYMGALMAGATVVNLNPLYAPRELERLVNDSGSEIIVTMDLGATYPKAHGLLHSTTAKSVIVCSMVDALPFFTGLLFRAFKSSTLATVSWDSRHMKFSDIVANDGKFTPPHPRQHHRQCAPGVAVGREPGLWPRAVSGRLALLPRLRHERGHAVRVRIRRRDRHDAALRS